MTSGIYYRPAKREHPVGPLGTAADCALICVRLPGHWSNVADRGSGCSRGEDQSSSLDELTPEGAEQGAAARLHLGLSHG